MGQSAILTELVVSVAGGVITALILAMFSRSNRSAAARTERSRPNAARSPSAIGSFMRLFLAVCGGVVVAIFAGRIMVRTGLIPPGPLPRTVLLVVAICLLWLVMPFGRHRT